MGRIAGRPSPLPTSWLLVAALVVAPSASGAPADDPKPKAKASAGKAKPKAKGKEEPKADDPKPKAVDEKKVEEDARKKDAALKAAEAYLVLLDKGKYGESWDAMTADLKKGITRRKWVDALGKTRGTYGPLRARKLNRALMRATEVADRLDEAWVYTDFRTLDGQAASELIIVVLDKGKDWVVGSYYIGDPANFPKPPSLDEGPKPAAK